MKRKPVESLVEQEAYWIDIIEQARKHPVSVVAYCRENDVLLRHYYVWFARLRPAHPEWQNLRNAKQRIKRTQSKQHPEVEVLDNPKRRRFNAGYKSRILRETDAAATKGEISAILRREGLYASHLHKWRAERDLAALASKKRGPKTNPLTAENRKLKAENLRLQKQLKQASSIIDLQKKVSEILGVSLQQSEEEK